MGPGIETSFGCNLSSSFSQGHRVFDSWGVELFSFLPVTESREVQPIPGQGASEDTLRQTCSGLGWTGAGSSISRVSWLVSSNDTGTVYQYNRKLDMVQFCNSPGVGAGQTDLWGSLNGQPVKLVSPSSVRRNPVSKNKVKK